MKYAWVILIGVSLFLSACGTGTSLGAATGVAPTDPAILATPTSGAAGSTAAEQAAIRALAKALGVPAQQVSVVSTEPVTWPNGCMGIQRPGVMCTLHTVPGFRIILQAGGKKYEIHTNEDGTVTAPEQPTLVSNSAQQAAVHQLASNLGIADSAVKLVSTTVVEWPDSCLGVAQQGVMCAQVVTPGYLFTLEADGRQYEYHTNQDASRIMPASLALDWHEEGGIAGVCQTVTLYLSGEVYGLNCRPGGDGRMGLLTAGQRSQLYAWSDELANTSVDLSDPKGAADGMTRTANLYGGGAQPASATEKRDIFNFGNELYRSLYK